LIENSPELHMIKNVYQKSTALCMKKFEKPIIEEFTHLDLLIKFNNRRRSNLSLRSPQQKKALKTLFAWRDAIARTEDESCGYVLPNHMLIQLADRLPREPQGVLALCNPIPPMVRQHQMEIHTIIQDAINSRDDDDDVTMTETEEQKEVASADVSMTTEVVKNTIVTKMPHENVEARDEKKLANLRKMASRLAAESCLFPDVQSKSLKRMSSNKSDSEAQKKKKLRLMSDLQWNPLQMFMQDDCSYDNMKSTDEGETPSLKKLLTGMYKWKVVKPKREVEAEEVKEKAPQRKEAGQIIEIDEKHYVSTEENVRRLQQKKKERKREKYQNKKFDQQGERRKSFTSWQNRKGGRR